MLRFAPCLLGGLAAVALSGGTAAFADEERKICGPREKIIERLAARYDERQSAIGMTGGGSLVELFVSPDGTWTFVHTTTEGVSCLLAAGEDWEQVPYRPSGPDATPS
jgi:hypothetical protein